MLPLGGLNFQIFLPAAPLISLYVDFNFFFFFFQSIEGQEVPAECALKVFKTTLNEFKNRDKYIKDDYRFKDRFSKLNPRKIIRMWAEKEKHNLKRYAELPAVLKHIKMMQWQEYSRSGVLNLFKSEGHLSDFVTSCGPQ